MLDRNIGPRRLHASRPFSPGVWSTMACALLPVSVLMSRLASTCGASFCASTTPLASRMLIGACNSYVSAHSKRTLNLSPFAPAKKLQRRLYCLRPVLMLRFLAPESC